MTEMSNGTGLDSGAATYESAADLHDTGLDGLPDRRTRVAPYPGIGPNPTTARLLLSALLWANTRTVLNAAVLVHPADLDEPATTILAAIYTCARGGQVGHALVLDRIVRDGDASRAVRDELTHATTAGGRTELIQDYAAAVLADRFRVAAESYGRGIVAWAADGSEAELWMGVKSGGAALRRLAERLERARGGELQ